MEHGYSKEICSIIMNVLFVASFLCIFFFTYASKIEGDVIQEQVGNLVKDLSEDIQYLPSELINGLSDEVAIMKKPNLDDDDAKVEANNSAIMKKTFTLIGTIVAIGMICIYLASRYWNFSFLEIFIKNIIILVFIGLTEFTFLMCFGRNYMLGDPNVVKLAVLNKLS